MTQCHFSFIFPIIAEMALGCLSDSHRGKKPILSGLQGTWRAIRQPDIFLEKSPAERELLRVQLTTSRSDFSRELTLEKKILRHSFFSCWYPHSYTLSHILSTSRLASRPPLYTHTFASLLFLLPFGPRSTIPLSHFPPYFPFPFPLLSSLQINITL